MNTKDLTILVGEMRSLIDQFEERAAKIREELPVGEPTLTILNQLQNNEVNSTNEVVQIIQDDIINAVQTPGGDNSQFRGQIIDVFEKFCDKNGIEIENPEKEEYDREAGFAPGENNAKLFGRDYDAIADSAVGLVAERRTSVNVAITVTNTFDAILASHGSRRMTVAEREALQHEVRQLLNEWCLLRESVVV